MTARRVLLAAIAAAIVSAAASPARAEQSPVRLNRVVRPFGKVVAEGVWLQRIVVVENNTKTPSQVKVVFETTDARGETSLYTRILTVPGKSRRKARIAIRVGQLREIGRKVRDMPLCESGMALRDAKTNELLDTKPDEVPKIDLTRTIVASISGDYERYDHTVYMDRLDDTDLGSIRRLSSVGTDLHPDHWYAYDIAKMILVGWIKPGQLRPSQVEAILDWTRRGGVLVLTGSFSLPKMLTQQFAAAAGVSAVGIHHVTTLEMAKPGRKPLPTISLEGPLPMVELCPDGAEVLWTGNGLPLLTRHAFGRGWVFTLATPVGGLVDRVKLRAEDAKAKALWKRRNRGKDKEWIPGPIQHPVWESIGDAFGFVPAVDDDRFAEPAETALRSIEGLQGPPRVVPVLFVAALIVATVAIGVAMRRRRRGELLWAILLPLGIAMGVGFYVFGLTQAGPERVSFIGLISGLGGQTVRVQQLNAYNSGPDAQEHVTFTSGPGGTISGVGGAGDAMSTVEIRDGATMSMPITMIQKDLTRGFHTDTILRGVGLTGRLSFSEKGLAGSMQSRFGADVNDAVIYVNHRVYRVGSISADAPTEIAIDDSRRRERAIFVAAMALDSDAALRNAMVSRLVTKPSFMKKLDTGPVLIGYTSASRIRTLQNRSPQRQGWSAIIWPLTIAPPTPGSRVVIPSGFVNLDFRRGAAVWDPTRQAFHKSTNPADLIVDVRPPGSVGRLTKASAKLKIVIRAQSYRLIVSGIRGKVKAPGSHVKIESFENPAGTLDLTVPDLERFRAPNGSFVLSLKVERLTGNRPVAPEDIVQWGFASVDVTLEGISR